MAFEIVMTMTQDKKRLENKMNREKWVTCHIRTDKF